VLAERAVDDFPRSTRAIKAGLGLPLKMRGEERTSPHYLRRFLIKSPRWQARRARGAGRRATPRLGVPKGVCPLRGDSTKGLAPL